MLFVITAKNITDVRKHPIMFVTFITWLKSPSYWSSYSSNRQKKNCLSNSPDVALASFVFVILYPRQAETDENMGKLGLTTADAVKSAGRIKLTKTEVKLALSTPI